jgi:5-methylcytosine-specific restriction endonuclease McrA
MPYKDPIKRKEYLKQYRKTEKYKTYEQSPYRLQYLKDHRLSDIGKNSKRRYMKTDAYKISHRASMKKYEETDKHKESQQRWKNSDKRIQYIKAWNKTPKGILNMTKKRLKRRAIKNNIIETFKVKEWMIMKEATKGICPCCNKYVGLNDITLDHIFAISLAYQEYLRTGIKRIYTIKDIQPLCRSCNSIKLDKLIT